MEYTYPEYSYRSNKNRKFNCIQLIISYTRRLSEDKLCNKSVQHVNCCIEKVESTFFFKVIYENEDYMDLMLPEPKQLNWGWGPTMGSRFYRANKKNMEFYVWYCDRLLDWKTFAFLLEKNSLKSRKLLSHKDLTYTRVEQDKECAICFENKKKMIVCAHCEQKIACYDCFKKNHDKCTLCHRKLDFENTWFF